MDILYKCVWYNWNPIQMCVVQLQTYTNLCGTMDILYRTSQEVLHPREPGYTNLCHSGTTEIIYKFVWYNWNPIEICVVQLKPYRNVCGKTEIMYKCVSYN